MSIVIRYIPVSHRWYICHARSYQNALGSKVNGFLNHDAAVAEALARGMTVEFHDDDFLQVQP